MNVENKQLVSAVVHPHLNFLPFPVKKTIPLLEVNGQIWSIEEIQKM
jgi:hypothetical protein